MSFHGFAKVLMRRSCSYPGGSPDEDLAVHALVQALGRRSCSDPSEMRSDLVQVLVRTS